MFPWLWFWAPHLQFPLSGNVSQDIDPIAHLFSGSVDPEAGNPRIEQKAFRVASYGKQLGLLAEVLIAVAEHSLPAKGKDNEALQELKRIREAIQKIKDHEYDAELRDVEHKVNAIRRRGGERSRRLSKSLLSSVEAQRP